MAQPSADRVCPRATHRRGLQKVRWRHQRRQLRWRQWGPAVQDSGRGLPFSTSSCPVDTCEASYCCMAVHLPGASGTPHLEALLALLALNALGPLGALLACRRCGGGVMCVDGSCCTVILAWCSSVCGGAPTRQPRLPTSTHRGRRGSRGGREGPVMNKGRGEGAVWVSSTVPAWPAAGGACMQGEAWGAGRLSQSPCL